MESSRPQVKGRKLTIHLSEHTPQRIFEFIDALEALDEFLFQNKLSELLINSIERSLAVPKPSLTLPLPEYLGKDHLEWIQHPFTKQLLTSWLLQLLKDVPNATSSEPTRLVDPSSGPSPGELTDANPPEKDSGIPPFQIRSSYHAKLVGFFLEDD